MSKRNILIKKRNGSSWDELYPITTANNVKCSNGKDIESELADMAKDLGQVKNDVDNIETTAEKTTLDSTKFTSNNVKGALEELFTSADNLKTKTRDAIIGKGGSVPTNPTSTELASAINNVSSWDPDLIAENIKKDISIFGVNGSLPQIIFSVGDNSIYSLSYLYEYINEDYYTKLFNYLININGQIRLKIGTNTEVSNFPSVRVKINENIIWEFEDSSDHGDNDDPIPKVFSKDINVKYGDVLVIEGKEANANSLRPWIDSIKFCCDRNILINEEVD